MILVRNFGEFRPEFRDTAPNLELNMPTPKNDAEAGAPATEKAVGAPP
jgi:hypothetical protein